MRRFEKKENITKANKLAEERYLKTLKEGGEHDDNEYHSDEMVANADKHEEEQEALKAAKEKEYKEKKSK